VPNVASRLPSVLCRLSRISSVAWSRGRPKIETIKLIVSTFWSGAVRRGTIRLIISTELSDAAPYVVEAFCLRAAQADLPSVAMEACRSDVRKVDTSAGILLATDN
jgi:hypothetical protein